MKWIKISDQTPPFDTPLLIAVDSYLDGKVITGATLLKYDWSEELFWWCAGQDNGDNRFTNKDVTHWAIPELPEE